MTGHFTSYENRTDHELTTNLVLLLQTAGVTVSVPG
jgi:hypothetical protein